MYSAIVCFTLAYMIFDWIIMIFYVKDDSDMSWQYHLHHFLVIVIVILCLIGGRQLIIFPAISLTVESSSILLFNSHLFKY